MESVYGLLNALCESICEKSAGKCDLATLKRCRKLAFETLFEAGNGIKFQQNTNIFEELQLCIFEQRLRADTVAKKDQAEALEKCVESITKSGAVGNDIVSKNVLELLLHLRDTIRATHNGTDEKISTRPIDHPLHNYYAPLPSNNLLMDNRLMQATSNPYLRSLKSSESDSSLSSVLNSQMLLLEKVKSETNMQRRRPLSSVFSSVDTPSSAGSLNGLDTPGPLASGFQRSYLPPGAVSRTPLLDGPMRRSYRRSSGRHRRVLNWENLGNRSMQKEPMYATESGHLLSMMSVKCQSQNAEEFVANIIPLEALMIDVKYLLVGISSESFMFNTELTFTSVPNLSLDDVAPATFQSVIREFIECGTCFKRLQLMTMRKDPNTFDHIYEGLIFKTLCESVETYLIQFRKFVLTFDDTTLLGLHKRTTGLRKQIITLAKILDIHPLCAGTKKLAQGSEFLVCLFRATVPVTEPEVLIFLMYILKNCCQVYFGSFEKWIFQGHLVDHHQELFIRFMKGYDEKTKAHFDKAYQIVRDAVPAFLHGCENDILICGKYTMLLRQYNPTHPIFTMDRFKLKVCLTFAEQADLQRQCDEYVRTAKALCGVPVTVAQILKQKYQKREELQTVVAERARQNYERWRLEQEVKAIELSKFKELQREELRLQMEEIRGHKLAEKKANILRELQYLKEAQAVDDQRLLAENAERLKRIEYYEELNRMIEEKHQRTEKLVNQLRQELKIKELSPQINGLADDVMAMSIGSENLSPDDDKLKRSSLSVSSPSLTDSVIAEQGFELEILPKMKKSESDVLNANHLISDCARNRQKVLGSSVIDHLNLDTTVKIDATSSISGDADNNNLRQLTEAQRNKLRVLSSEFGISLESIELLENGDNTEALRNKARILGSQLFLEDIPETVDPTRELTDLQRNRMKIMSQEYGLMEAPIEAKRRPMINLDTARARNRRKILESEYNIVTGEEAGTVSRPESRSSRTTSDTPTTPDLETIHLRVDIELANDNIPESLAIPNTAVMEQPTPESAITGRIGFKFSSPSKTLAYQMDTIDSPIKRPVSSNGKQSAGLPLDPMCEDFVKAIQRKMFNLMPLNFSVASTRSVTASQIGFDKYDELRYLDSITLTKFFQQSISLPLNAHMEVINGEILRLFLVDLDVIGQFKSLRNFFFMMDGEFGMTICDGLLQYLENGAKPAELLNFRTLHTLLDTALGASNMGSDINTDKLSFSVEKVLPSEFDLGLPDALSMLSLNYKVSWPLNLILNPESLNQYSNIFKYLVKVRRLAWVLEASFQYLKESRRKHTRNFLAAPQYRRIEEVRHKLHHFMQALLNHITRTALQESWKKLKIELGKTVSIEEIYRKHVQYLKRILFILMLKDKCVKFRDYLERAFILILKFYRCLVSSPFIVDPTDPKNFIHPHYENIIRIEKNFKVQVDAMLYIGLRMVNTGFQQEIGEFLNLINMNDYYEPKLTATQNKNS